MEQDTIAIKENVKKYVVEHTFVEKNKLKDDSLFFKEGYVDSMGFIMLITFIEDEYKFNTDDADLIEENFESINAISKYILKKITK